MEARQHVETRLPTEVTEAQTDLVYDGLRVHLQPAPFMLRALALAVDYGCLYVVSLVALLVAALLFVGGALSLAYLSEVLGQAADASQTLLIILAVLVFLGAMMLLTHGYFIYWEYKRNGQTPGKRLFGLRVVTLDGSPLSLGKCLTREAIRYVDMLFIVPGLLACLLTSKRQRLGDLLAGTMVAYSRHEAQERDYLYVKQSDYRYLLEVLSPLPVPEATRSEFLSFAYQEFVRTRGPAQPSAQRETWDKMARQYVPQATTRGLDQLTTLLFFAEYCYQTANTTKPS